MVAHDPIYPIETAPDLTPCADGAGIIEAVGEGSMWKIGQRVMLMSSGWVGGDVPDLEGMKLLGAGSVQGTLREYAVVVSMIVLMYLH